MKNKNDRRQFLKLAFTAIPGALAFSSCGTLLHPERRGRTGGRLDTRIVILDGLLCLLFIIPGVIAFAVDFSTGAIYTSGGHAKLNKHDVLGGTEADYNRVLTKATGKQIKLSDDELKASDHKGEISAKELQLAVNNRETKKAKLITNHKGRIVRAEFA